MISNNIKISIVSPVYRAENIINELVSQIKINVSKLTEYFEIILVNDCSPDSSWSKIVKECTADSRVKGVDLSKNFGQHYAITAGLKYAKGEWIVVMDCDLQDRPDEIINLYNKAIEGYDSVFAQRIQRNDTFFKRNLSNLFYKIFSYLTDTKQDPTVANFGIYNKKVIESILSMQDQIKFFPTMVQWVGFKKYYLEVQHSERFEGTTSYDLKKLFNLAINTIIAFSDKPLRLTAKIGFFISLFAFLIGIIYTTLYYIGHIHVIGFTSLILTVWFLSGVIITILGIIGLYLGKVFEKVKNRPGFIVSEFINI